MLFFLASGALTIRKGGHLYVFRDANWHLSLKIFRLYNRNKFPNKFQTSVLVVGGKKGYRANCAKGESVVMEALQTFGR